MSNIICLMGPTGSGKTKLAIELVQRLPCEIISVDSAMIYREMDIGTAKPSQDEQKIAPHHLIDICDPAEIYSTGQFCKDATTTIENIFANNKIPLLVGGTMLYFHSLLRGISALPQSDNQIRDTLTQEAAEKGWEFLHQRLSKIDPISANRIHPNDSQRIQRALEVYLLTGKSLTALIAEKRPSPLGHKIIPLALIPSDRELLNQRLLQRFQQMLKMGFIDEVKKLYDRGDLHCDLPSMRAVGYRQAWQYLAGQITNPEMIEKAVIATRQLAKRQLTWLRGWNDMINIDSEDSQLLSQVISVLIKSGINI